MYIFAYAALLIGLVCALGAGFLGILQLKDQETGWLGLIRKAHWVIALCLLFASAMLMHGLFWQDYRLEYVASYTDSTLPLFYRLTAFWAGQPGSLLFWAMCCAICGLVWQLRAKSSGIPRNTELWFWVFYSSIMAFFLLLLSGWSNPFIIMEPAPLDGQGLNPLLQNPGMILHPPLLFIGYAIFTVPACLGLAVMLTPQARDLPWLELSGPFILIAWLFLSAGILLGAWWAYMELGWGGYWGWDPVENASLLPWLAGTAALHVIAIHKKSGKLDRASALLLASVLILAFFATYLTRSGILQSVHAFGDGGVGLPLLVFVLAAASISLFVVLSAKHDARPLASLFGREGAAILTAWLFLALAAIITFATMWPVISGFFGNAPMGLEPAFYNRVCLPLAALVLLILAICPWLRWSGGFKTQGNMRKLFLVGGVFLAALASLWVAGYRQPVALITSASVLAILLTLSMRVFKRSFWRDRSAMAAFGAHLGIALIALGVAFSGPYSVEKELFLTRDKAETVGPYQITLLQISDGEGPGYDYLKATLRIAFSEKIIGELEPERRIYAKFGSMQFSEVDVLSSLGEDIYASLLGIDEEHRVLVKIALEPLVNWIWIGGILMCLLPLCSFFIRKKMADR